MILSLKVKAKETPNPWDDIVVDLLVLLFKVDGDIDSEP